MVLIGYTFFYNLNYGVHIINTKYLLCHDCDLLIKNQVIEEDSVLRCPRCGHTLYKQKYNTISKSLAFTLTALILFYPAVTEPIMSISLSGKVQHQSLIEGTRVLLSEQYYLVAILTFMCSVLVPLFRLLLLFYITFSLALKIHHKSLFWSFRLYQHMEEWAMLDVYMLAIIVSVVKLSSMATVHPGFGLWTYAGLLLSSIFASITLNPHEVWLLLSLNRNEKK